MNQPNAITELQRLAEIITEQDLRMMISHGGANSVYQYIQLAIGARVEQLQHMEETGHEISNLADAAWPFN